MTSRRRSAQVRLTAKAAGLALAGSLLLLSVVFVTVDRSIARQPIEVPIVSAFPTTGTGPADEQVAVRLKQLSSQREQELRAGIRRNELPALLERGLVGTGLVVVAAAGLGWLVAGRTHRKVRRLTDAVRRISDHNLRDRIGLGGPREELRELADEIDRMLARLQAAFDGQRRFVGNASHELRTPLAVNRTLLEVAMSRPEAPRQLRELGGTLLEVTARQERLIDGLLTLASSERMLADKVLLDLVEIAEGVVAVARPEAERLGLDIRLTAPQEAPFEGHQVLVERLVQNLVENAMRYNTPCGWIRVAVETAADDVSLIVTNTGPAVPAAAASALFEPFRRVTDRVGSARGIGLGLSIVRSVAGAHGGSASAAAREGGGLIVEVRLPMPGSGGVVESTID